MLVKIPHCTGKVCARHYSKCARSSANHDTFTEDSLGNNFTIHLSLADLGDKTSYLNDKISCFSSSSKNGLCELFLTVRWENAHMNWAGEGPSWQAWGVKRGNRNKINSLQNMQHKFRAHKRGRLKRTKKLNIDWIEQAALNKENNHYQLNISHHKSMKNKIK